MIKNFIISFYILFLTGCATVGSYQTACEQQNTSFSNIVQCLKTSIASNSRMTNDARVKLYMLKADQLNQSVQNKEISEIDAKVALQQFYLQLKRDENSDLSKTSAALMLWSASQQENQKNISNAYWESQKALQQNTPINCTSQYLPGGIVNTNCR